MRPAALRDDESGVTLIELVVSMTIMAVMMTVFTTAVVQMYQAANKTESMSNAQAELNNVFLRLDRIVRYAAGISNLQQAGGRFVGSLSFHVTICSFFCAASSRTALHIGRSASTTSTPL